MNTADLINAVEVTSELLGQARVHEMTLEDQRPLVKQEATKRIMARDTLSATAAEKIVESDEVFMNHRKAQYAAVIATQTAWGQYEAAKLRAALAVKTHEVQS